jgi:hypothetical protein
MPSKTPQGGTMKRQGRRKTMEHFYNLLSVSKFVSQRHVFIVNNMQQHLIQMTLSL